MELIIDKGFLVSFFENNSSDKHKPLFQDFIDFVRKLQPNFTLVSNFTSLDELTAASAENALLEIIIEKIPDTIFLDDLYKEINEKDFYKQGSSMKFFLVDCSTKVCSELEKSFGCSFFCGENFKWKWEPYFTGRSDTVRYITTSKDIPENLKFDSWLTLKKYKHPFNAVLIVDNYILGDKVNQPIDQNLLPLLLHLLPQKKNTLPVDITIITEKTPKYKNFKEVQEELESNLKTSLPELNFRLNIIQYEKSILIKLRNKTYTIHDRQIITNYFVIDSGIGFNIMNNRGKLSKSNSKVTFSFNLLGPNSIGLKHILKGYADYAKIAESDYTFGDVKPNRLLQLITP